MKAEGIASKVATVQTSEASTGSSAEIFYQLHLRLIIDVRYLKNSASSPISLPPEVLLTQITRK